MTYFENIADVQMLAMLSCVLSKPSGKGNLLIGDQPVSKSSLPETLRKDHLAPYVSPEGHLEEFPRISSPHPYGNGQTVAGTMNMPSEIVQPIRDRRRQLSNTSAPSFSFRHSRSDSDQLELQNLSVSTSPEQLRHVPKSNSNLASAFTASLSRQFSFSTSISSSPPTRKGLSPAGSYIGAAQAGIVVGNTNLTGRWSTTLDTPRAPYSLPTSDNEEEAFVQKPVFRTTYKNQECRSDIEGLTNTSTLDLSQELRAKIYRATYGEILFAWDLRLQMCEILKYNDTAQLPHDDSSPNHSDIKFERSTSNKDSDFVGVGFKDNCLNCGNLLPKRDISQICSKCSVRKQPTICLFCDSLINGLAYPCLSCGHVLHVSCRATLQPDNSPYTCISGCGCRCAEHVSVEVAEPEETLQNAETVPISGLQEEVRERWRDVAYESLARNLGGPPRHLTPKTSQIWRGGDG